MAYIRRSQLKQYETNSRLRFAAERHMVKLSEKSRAQTTIFLSHSHKDADLVDAAVHFLASFDATIYVDWMDAEMPSVTSADTATALKNKISTHKKFIVLVSANAIESRWIPWELGYADGVRGLHNIASLPVAEDSGFFQGNEYLQIYPTIQVSNQGVLWRHQGQYVEIGDWLQDNS